ncbi:hypothetical protein [Sphingomonas panacisoli]|nr:hypothetical protein [Sphingomonas panacisoli]
MAAVEQLLKLAESLGVRRETVVSDWGDFKTVYWMADPMPLEVRELGRDLSELEYASYEGDPHNRADENFLDRDRRVAISFPRAC